MNTHEIARGITVKTYKVELIVISEIQAVLNKVRSNMTRVKDVFFAAEEK